MAGYYAPLAELGRDPDNARLWVVIGDAIGLPSTDLPEAEGEASAKRQATSVVIAHLRKLADSLGR